LKGREFLGDLGLYDTMILERNTVGTQWKILWTKQWAFRYHKKRGISYQLSYHDFLKIDSACFHRALDAGRMKMVPSTRDVFGFLVHEIYLIKVTW